MRQILVVTVLASLALPAAAEAPTGNVAVESGPSAQSSPQQACKVRVAAMCPGVQPGGGRLRDCLKKQGKTFADVCPDTAQRHQQAGPPGREGNATGPAEAPVATPPANQ